MFSPEQALPFVSYSHILSVFFTVTTFLTARTLVQGIVQNYVLSQDAWWTHTAAALGNPVAGRELTFTLIT